MTINLSHAASVVLGSTFGYGNVLTYGMQESVPSPEFQAVLDELVNDGKLVRETNTDDMPAHGEAVRYRVAPNVDLSVFRKIAATAMTMGTMPDLRIFIPKGST